ncbi:hypothetical protein GOP47_0022672 [Adiantum capillus-veneris]|uniref:ATP-dependent Clp protease proteolytic subunit n=1 Tax=Adiantum capillus-veneris TaxID=13818 RepID=A0A9D4U6Y0_ADICA|nr:hypothetical protein GOP47_0022672 [Adiantum capillus-veneris]
MLVIRCTSQGLHVPHPKRQGATLQRIARHTRIDLRTSSQFYACSSDGEDKYVLQSAPLQLFQLLIDSSRSSSSQESMKTSRLTSLWRQVSNGPLSNSLPSAATLSRVRKPTKANSVVHQLSRGGCNSRSCNLRHHAVYKKPCERRSLPNARVMIHQPSGGASGQASDIAIHAREILDMRSRLNKLYVKHTGASLDLIEQSMERDKFLSPDEAKEFGLIDEVIARRPDSLVSDAVQPEKKSEKPT